MQEKGGDGMKLLEERIRRDGQVLEDGAVLKLDSFLNHQMDVGLFNEMGKEFFRFFGQENVTKILTIEASGIGIACIAGQYFDVPVLFAKKGKSRNIDPEVYSATVASFTREGVNEVMVSKRYLQAEDRVLIIDDFLSNGSALDGLISIVEQAGATVVGAGVCVEKAFQTGGVRIRGKGIRVEALARIAVMSEDGIEFC